MMNVVTGVFVESALGSAREAELRKRLWLLLKNKQTRGPQVLGDIFPFSN